MPNYPDCPLITNDLRFKEETISALKKFKALGPWKGPIEERESKFRSLHEDLCRIYEIPAVKLFFEIDKPYCNSGNSCYNHSTQEITLRGRFSVVTYLHEFAHAFGDGEFGAVKWSVNLFRKVFPEKMEMLRPEGHVLVKTTNTGGK